MNDVRQLVQAEMRVHAMRSSEYVAQRGEVELRGTMCSIIFEDLYLPDYTIGQRVWVTITDGKP